jgi:hypothetical protein
LLPERTGAESLLSQTFDFSDRKAPIHLAWENWYEIFVSFDIAEVRVNGDLVFEVATTAATPDYIQEHVDLSAYAGNPSVTITFRLFATTVVNRSGWYVDDIAIQDCAASSNAPALNNLGLGVLAICLAAVGVLLLRRRVRSI